MTVFFKKKYTIRLKWPMLAIMENYRCVIDRSNRSVNNY